MKAIRRQPYCRSYRLYPRFLAALLVAALSACSLFSGTPTPASQPPAQETPGQSAAGSQNSGRSAAEAPQGGEEDPGEIAGASAPRPTQEAVPALSEGMPFFPGLFWTEDLLVEALPEGVIVTSMYPCSQLFDLLGSGEWTMTSRAIPAATMSLSPALGRLEWGNQIALVRAMDLGVEVDLEALEEGAPVPTAPPDPNAIIGCAATIVPVSEQTLEASGAFEGSGNAYAYPLLLGCTQVEDSVSVNMMYEGPGSLRASLTLSVPQVLGEHELDYDNLELNLAEREQSLIDEFARIYAQGGQDEAADDLFTEFYPAGEQAGRVRVTNLDPLEGVVELEGWESENGESQSFQAGFHCSSLQSVTP